MKSNVFNCGAKKSAPPDLKVPPQNFGLKKCPPSVPPPDINTMFQQAFFNKGFSTKIFNPC